MIKLFSGCKINLGLQIKKRLPSGYHEIESIFLPLKWPGDIIEISPDNSGLTFKTNDKEIENADNLILKAYKAFYAKTGFHPSLNIYLHKNIPVGSGLGGGSGNAAAILNWLNIKAPNQLNYGELLQLAAQIGADVCFFLDNKTALVQGIGEVLHPCALDLDCFIILVWPQIAVSTAWAYGEYDKKYLRPNPDENYLTKLCMKDKENFPYGKINFSRIKNDLEPVVFEFFPQLAALKQNLLDYGAEYAAMSGSGSAVYGLFNRRELAIRALHSLKTRYSHVYFAHLDTGM